MAQCKAKTAKGTRCTRKVAAGNKSYCKQHSEARSRKIKKKIPKKKAAKKPTYKKKKKLTKRKIKRAKAQKANLLKKLAEMADIEGHPMAQILKVMQSGPQSIISLMQVPQPQGCGDPDCTKCGPPPKELLEFAHKRDEKIIEMYETTNKPLWEIAKLAHVDEGYVIKLCQSLGLDRGDEKIGGPETWAPLFRPRYYPSRPIKPLTHRRLRRYRRNPRRNLAPYNYF
jgi:hypothetical protein